ncbi:histone-lysine N-methyltransferase 2B isoform X2 [Ascaphus truei]|uniref:histone-lysine N-methyltransferase 2B isoform X2 n=1 Tax=Ascaphus truei TaxID=8439 RepID=UPI003F5A083B
MAAAAASAGPGASGSVRGRFPGRPWGGRSGNRAERARVPLEARGKAGGAECTDPALLRILGLRCNMKRLTGACGGESGDSDSGEEEFLGFSTEETRLKSSLRLALRSNKGRNSAVMASSLPPTVSPTKKECPALPHIRQAFTPEKVVRVNLTPLKPSLCGLLKSTVLIPSSKKQDISPKASASPSSYPFPSPESELKKELATIADPHNNSADLPKKGRPPGSKNRTWSVSTSVRPRRRRRKTHAVDFSPSVDQPHASSSVEVLTNESSAGPLRGIPPSQTTTRGVKVTPPMSLKVITRAKSVRVRHDPPALILSQTITGQVTGEDGGRAKGSLREPVIETDLPVLTVTRTAIKKRGQRDGRVPKVKWKLRAGRRQVIDVEIVPSEDQRLLAEEVIPQKGEELHPEEQICREPEERLLNEEKIVPDLEAGLPLEVEAVSERDEMLLTEEGIAEKDGNLTEETALEKEDIIAKEEADCIHQEKLPPVENTSPNSPGSVLPAEKAHTEATEISVGATSTTGETIRLTVENESPSLPESPPTTPNKRVKTLRKSKKGKLTRSQKAERAASQRLLAKVKAAQFKAQPQMQTQSSKVMQTRSGVLKSIRSFIMPVMSVRSSRVIKTPRRFMDEQQLSPTTGLQARIAPLSHKVELPTSTLAEKAQEGLSDSLSSLTDPSFHVYSEGDSLKLLPVSPHTDSTLTASSPPSSSASSPSLTPAAPESTRKTILREPTFRWNSFSTPESQPTPSSNKPLFRLSSPASPEEPLPPTSPASAPPSPPLSLPSQPVPKSDPVKRAPLLRAPQFTPSEEHLKIYQSVSLQDSKAKTPPSSSAVPNRIHQTDQKLSNEANASLPERGEVLVPPSPKQSDLHPGGRRTNHLTLPLFDTASEVDSPCNSTEPILIITESTPELPEPTQMLPEPAENLSLVTESPATLSVLIESLETLEKPLEMEPIKIGPVDCPAVVCKVAIRPRSPSPVEKRLQEKSIPVETSELSLSGTDKKVICLLEKAKLQLIKIDKQKSPDMVHSQVASADAPKDSASPPVPDENSSRPQAGQSQDSPLQGPRIKHVCRHPAVALGQPRAMIPEDIPRLSALPLEEREADVPSPAPPEDSSSASEQESSARRPKSTKAEPVAPARRARALPHGKLRMARCGTCKGCLVQRDCGKCLNCLDKTKFGGPNTKKQCCVNRRCVLIEARKQQRLARKGRGVIRLPPIRRDSPTESEDTYPDVCRSEETEVSDRLEPDQMLQRKSSRRCVKQRTCYQLFPDSEDSDYDPSPSAPRRKQRRESDLLPQESEEQSRPRKTPQQPMILRARNGPERVSVLNGCPSKLKSVDGTLRLRVDFKEDCDLQNVWLMGGLSILTSVPVAPALNCLLCASQGLHQLIYCQVCCEPFHAFCLEESERPLLGQEDTWCCRHCKFCNVCGRKGKTKKPLLECELCQTNYHVNCLGPNYPVKPPRSRKGWICMACVRCKGCGASSKIDGDLELSEEGSLCPECTTRYEKGNLCPICIRCYEESDYESKMIQCAKCVKWVHAKCEGLSDEGYEILSNLPDSVVYTCPPCLGSNCAIWREAMLSELTAGLHEVLQGLLTSQLAAPLLLCTRCCSRGGSGKCHQTPCDLQSLGQLLEDGHYNSVNAFNDDLARIIQKMINKEERGLLDSRGEAVKSLYLKFMGNGFSWFRAEESTFWENRKPVANGVLPNAVQPPSSDHTYAHWRLEDDCSVSTNGVAQDKASPKQVKREVGSESGREAAAEKDTRQCALCLKYGDDEPKDAGRLLYIGQNEWTHINCAIWSAEVFEENDGSLKNVHAAVARGRQMRCEHCSKPGATVGCCLSTCMSNFHFMCARLSRCSFQDDKKMFCSKHTKLLDGTTVASDGFDVLRRVYVDFEGISFKRKFLLGLEPESIHMMIGSMKIDRLGMLSDLSVSEGKLFPVGYQCSRLYWSTLDARRRCWYKCRILEHRPRAGDAHPETMVDQGENQTTVHSSAPSPGPKRQEAAFIPPLAEQSQGHPPPLEPVTTAVAPRSFTGARIKTPNYSPSRRPLGGSSRPLPSPGSPSSSPLSHHILTVSDPEVTPLRRARRPAPPSRTTRQSSTQSSKDPTSPPFPLSAHPLTRHSSSEGETTVQLMCDVGDMEVVSSLGLDGGLVAGPLQCGAQLVVGSELPADESEGASSSEDEVGDRYYGLTRTVVSQEAESPLEPSATSGHIIQLDGIHDSTDSEDGSQGPRGPVGSGKTPSHLPSDIVDFVLKNTGNLETASPTQQPQAQQHVFIPPPPSSSSTQNGDAAPSLSNGTDCAPHQSSQGPPPLRDPPQLQRVYRPPPPIPRPPLCAPEPPTVTVHKPGSKIILVNKLGQLFMRVQDGSPDLSSATHFTAFPEAPRLEPLSTLPVIKAPPLKLASKAAQRPLPSSSLNTVILQATAPSPITLSEGQSWTLHSPVLGVLPMLNVVQSSGHLTLGSSTLMAPTLTGLPQACLLQGLSMNSGLQGLSMNSGLQGLSMNSGLQGLSMNSGLQGLSMNSGLQGLSMNSGLQGLSMNSGLQGLSMNSGLQGVSMNSGLQGLSMNSGLQGISPAPGQQHSLLPLIQPGPRKVLPRPSLTIKRTATSNYCPNKKVKIERVDRPVVTSSLALNFNCVSSTSASTGQRRARIKAPMVREVLDLDSVKQEDLSESTGLLSLHAEITLDVKSEDTQLETPQNTPYADTHQGYIPNFEDYPFREEKENRPRNKGSPHLRFEIISEDGFYIQADTAEGAWKAVLEKVQEARGVGRLRHLAFSAGMNGARMLGVQHDAVLFLLEQLSGAERCRGYKFLFHPQEMEEEELPINSTGCARSEVYVRKCTFDMFNFLASQHRTLPECGPCEEEEEEVQLKSTRRATSLDLPMAMRFRHLKRTSKEAVGVYRSAIHGRGLFCKRNIDPGEMVIEYSGIVIRSVLTDKREKFYDGKGIGCYMFRIDDFDVVDATMHGNAARFINHSCEPNCYSRVIHVDGQKHIVIFALRSIYRGEELTYDYKFPIEDASNKLNCNCGAKKCRRFLN